VTHAIMKSTKAGLVLAAVLLGVAASGSALAWGHGPHVRFGVVLGGPFWWGPPYYAPYYPPPYYYFPPVVTAPPVYVERGGAHAAARRQTHWYYCAASRSYYPYVRECPGGWQRVATKPG
jgi:hypothetical protein